MKKKYLQIQKEYERLLKLKEKDLQYNYKEAYQELRKELQKIYDKYNVKGQISMDSLRKYNRMKKLDMETAYIMTQLYKNNKKVIRGLLQGIYNDTVRSSLKVVDNRLTIAAIQKTVDPTSVINAEVAGRIWVERINHYGNNFVYDIHSVIKQGIERGDTYTTMSNNLQKKFGKDLGNTQRIARTEGHRVLSVTRDEAMGEINKEIPLQKTWRTMADERVRGSHQAMEGVTIPYDDEFRLPSGARATAPTLSGDPAEDIECRCYLEYAPIKE